jgi:hypothetical protein
VDESASEYVHAEFSRRVGRQTRCVQRIHFEAGWVYRFGRCSRSCSRNSHGRPEKHGGKDYCFSADALAPGQVAETLTAATGHKFTAEVRDVERFAKEVGGPGSAYESAYAKGGPQFFREVEHGNGVHRKRKRRYKENSRSRTIVAEGMGKSTRQGVIGDCR